MLARVLIMKPHQLVLHLIPLLIARRHLRQHSQPVHDGIYRGFYRLGQIPVLVLATQLGELLRQLQHHLLYPCIRTSLLFHLRGQFQQLVLRRLDAALIDFFFADVDILQLLPEDGAGELGTHGEDTFLRQVSHPRIVRPHHHVDVGVMPLVMKRCVPPQLVLRDAQCLRQCAGLLEQQGTPSGGIVVAGLHGILPPQRKNECPHAACVGVQFCHGFVQICDRRCTEQPMPTVLFRPWPLGDILHVAALRLHLVQVAIQRGGDIRRCRGAVRRGEIVLILKQLLRVGIVFQQIRYELPLLFRHRTSVTGDLHTVPLGDVFHVSGATAFEVAAFLYQPRHSLLPPMQPQGVPEGKRALGVGHLPDAVAAVLAVHLCVHVGVFCQQVIGDAVLHR